MKYLQIFNRFVNSILLNEANVILSPDFKNVLIKMNHPLAEEILKFEGQDKPISNNYFNVKSDSNDIITFITDRKQKELAAKVNWGKYELSKFDPLNPKAENKKYYDNLGMDLPIEIKSIPVGEVGEVERMWTSPSSGKVWCKFVPLNKDYDPIMINMNNLKKLWDDDVFFNQNRQDIKIGRGLRSLLTGLGIKFTDKDIEEFVNKWKATIDRINDIFSNFEIVSGQKIAYWYDFNNYFDQDKGTLGNSCMREVDSEFFDIYTSNKNIEMVIYKSIDNEDKIMGRALLWTFDDGKKFMDRIYTTNDSDVELFRQFAKDRGFYCKYQNSSTTNLKSFSPDGSVVDLGDVDITLTKEMHSRYPYLDTFKYYSPRTGIITNNSNRRAGFIELQSTDGYGYYDGDPDEEENMIYVPFYGREIPENELIYVEWCDPQPSGRNRFSDGYRFEDDCFYSRYYGVWVSKDLSEKIGKRCSVTDEWRLEEDLKKIYHKGRGSDRYIINNYYLIPARSTRGNDYRLSNYHDMYIPDGLAIQVYSDSTSPIDWRIKDDGSYKEVDGLAIDKASLIKKEISNESKGYISRFVEFKK